MVDLPLPLAPTTAQLVPGVIEPMGMDGALWVRRREAQDGGRCKRLQTAVLYKH